MKSCSQTGYVAHTNPYIIQSTTSSLFVLMKPKNTRVECASNLEYVYSPSGYGKSLAIYIFSPDLGLLDIFFYNPDRMLFYCWFVFVEGLFGEKKFCGFFDYFSY